MGKKTGVKKGTCRAAALVTAGAMAAALTTMTQAYAQSPSPEPSTSPSASVPAAPSVPAVPSAPASTSPPAARHAFDDLDTPDPRGKSGSKVPQARSGVTLRMGQVGAPIAAIQADLEWLGHTTSKRDQVDELFGPSTADAVRAFQAKHWLPATGRVDKRTRKTIERMAAPIGILPRTCTEKKLTICIDKTAKVLRLVDDGEVVLTTDARFGAPGMETGEGIFAVKEKSRNHTSSRYHTWMPFAMFFNGDEAVHYSPDFASVGYLHGSHGCVGVRDIAKAEWLFDHVPEGTRVYVYWS